MQNKRLFMTRMDFTAVNKPPIFLGTVKQLDGVTLKITPLSGHNPMTMIGVTPKLYAKKPNGEFVYQDVDIDVDLSTSQMSIQCKNFMFSDVGTVEMEIELYDDDNYLITSPTFEIDVAQKLNQIGMEDLKEGVHISLLEELMDYIAESKDYVERFKELLSEFGDDDTTMLENLTVVRMMLETLSSEVDRLENTIAQAQEYEFEMVNQETARVAAESLRFAAEEKRVKVEAARVAAEEKRVEVEADRVQAEDDRKRAESQREENEANRGLAEIRRDGKIGDFNRALEFFQRYVIQVIYEIEEPQDTWVIQHDLGKYPSVITFSEDGEIVHGHVVYEDANSIRVTFSESIKGRALIN